MHISQPIIIIILLHHVFLPHVAPFSSTAFIKNKRTEKIVSLRQPGTGRKNWPKVIVTVCDMLSKCCRGTITEGYRTNTPTANVSCSTVNNNMTIEKLTIEVEGVQASVYLKKMDVYIKDWDDNSVGGTFPTPYHMTEGEERTFTLRTCSRKEKPGPPFYFKRGDECRKCRCWVPTKSWYKCDSLTGACKDGYCEPGYAGLACGLICEPGTYGSDCLFNCSEHCQNQTACNGESGECPCKSGYTGDRCDQICPQGRYGPNCIYPCNECASDICDRFSGNCTPLGDCKIGWDGAKCDRPCPSKHFRHGDSNCTPPGHCNLGWDGAKCDRPCASKHFGLKCAEECHCYLEFTCDPVTGDCGSHGCEGKWTTAQCNQLDQCPLGHYGKNCIPCGGCMLECIEATNTTEMYCDGHCNEYGVCPLGCIGNYVGERCDRCKPSFYGRTCVHKCGHCLDIQDCNVITGECGNKDVCADGYLGTHCSYECRENFWGFGCSRNCSGNCAGGAVCNHVDGSCESCKLGWAGRICDELQYCSAVGMWGENCDKPCGHCRYDESCGQYTGECEAGCEAGFENSRCDRVCRDGYWGFNCAQECGLCLDWEYCDKFTGECTHGCIGNFVYPLCKECPKEFSGYECRRPCGHCKLDHPCDELRRTCPTGCVRGFKGHFCDQRVGDDYFDALDDIEDSGG